MHHGCCMVGISGSNMSWMGPGPETRSDCATLGGTHNLRAGLEREESLPREEEGIARFPLPPQRTRQNVLQSVILSVLCISRYSPLTHVEAGLQ